MFILGITYIIFYLFAIIAIVAKLSTLLLVYNFVYLYNSLLKVLYLLTSFSIFYIKISYKYY